MLRLALALWVALAASPSRAASDELVLLMFHDPGCGYCELWENEVGVIYARTDEGRRAPLVRRLLHASAPGGERLREPVRYTPTFVLLRAGEEVGRITGYPGEAHFWGLLDGLLQSSMRD